jgi:hypothetical protein
VAVSRSRAISWLDRNLVNLLDRNGDPYEVAIVAYAMMLAKSTSAEAAFGVLRRHAREDGGYIYWEKSPFLCQLKGLNTRDLSSFLVCLIRLTQPTSKLQPMPC